MNEKKTQEMCCMQSEPESAYARILREKEELDTRIEKLNMMIRSKRFMTFSYEQQNLMQEQVRFMTEYSCILNKRILCWEGD